MTTRLISVLLLLVGFPALPLLAQNDSSIPGVSVQTIVTAQPRKKGPLPTLNREDIMAFEGRTRNKVTSWIPSIGQHASLEFLILLDDDSGLGLASQLSDIRDFILSQPNTTAVGVGYMRNGTVQFTAPFTTNHQQAAGSLRIPMGQSGINGSPYFSLSDVVKRWQPGGAERREVLMVTDGIDRYGFGSGLQDPYVDAAIADCQKAGVVVYSIYSRGNGHFGRNFWRNNWGQNFLSELSEETGGESFWIGFGNPVSFKPYLDELSTQLNGQQFLAAVVMMPKDKAELRPIKFHTEVRNVDLAYPYSVWVPAGK